MNTTKPSTLFASLLVGVACSGLVACGSSTQEGLLAPSNANQLLGELDRVDRLSSEGRCTGAALVAGRLIREADALGSEVKPRLREALLDGAQRLERLLEIPGECETQTTTETTPTETTPTVTITTETQTVPPPAVTEPGNRGGGVGPPDEEPPPEEIPPPDENGNGGGNRGGGIGPGG